MYVVTVEFAIKAEWLEVFSKAVLTNAQTSLEQEPGCRQFDVCLDGDDPSHFFLYELYLDSAAFKLHLGTEHFKRFDATVAEWVESKHVKAWVVVGR